MSLTEWCTLLHWTCHDDIAFADFVSQHCCEPSNVDDMYIINTYVHHDYIPYYCMLLMMTLMIRLSLIPFALLTMIPGV